MAERFDATVQDELELRRIATVWEWALHSADDNPDAAIIHRRT